jgi:protein-tyrosine phosphatase
MEYILNRDHSRGWVNDPPAVIHPNVMFGSGKMLTIEFVKERNITHVINCAYDEDSPEWFRNVYPKKYACMNAQDSLITDITLWYPGFEKIMQKFLRENDSKVIFVHCQCGINRSGYLTLLYACLNFKFPLIETVKSIIKQRPCALTNPSFRIQVAEYITKNMHR